MLKSQVYKPNTFLYFAYGANILEYRMHMHTPTAEFVSIGRADNYRLQFIKFHKFWQGPEATMVPTANADVWGVIYRIHSGDIVSLNDAKGVSHDKYYVKYITVRTSYIGDYKCRVYIQKVNPLPRGDNDPIPCEYWPSLTYKTVLMMGAKEHDFPPYYIEELENIKDNGEEGCLRVFCLCLRYGFDEPCLCPVPGRIPRKPLKLVLKAPEKDEVSEPPTGESKYSGPVARDLPPRFNWPSDSRQVKIGPGF